MGYENRFENRNRFNGFLTFFINKWRGSRVIVNATAHNGGRFVAHLRSALLSMMLLLPPFGLYEAIVSKFPAVIALISFTKSVDRVF